jgi:WD40 repeat protein
VLKLWDLNTLAEQRTYIAHNRSAEAVAISPDGKRIASGADDGLVRILDASDGLEIFLLSAPPRAVRALAFSPDGKFVAVGGDDAKLRIWDVSGDRPQRPVRTFDHKMTIWSVAYAPNGKFLVTGSEDGTARVWDTNSNGNEVRGLQTPGPVHGVAISADGRYVAAGSARTVHVWQMETGFPVRQMEPGGATNAVAFGGTDGRVLAVGGTDKNVRLYDPETGRLLTTLEGHTAMINAVTFASDGSVLATAGRDGNVMLWATA